MLTLREVIDRARVRGVELRRTESGGASYLLINEVPLPLPTGLLDDDEIPPEYIRIICFYCPELDPVVDFQQDPG